MNKTELVASVAEKTGLAKKDAEAAVKAVFESIESAMVAGDKVQLIGFGTFSVVDKPASTATNPRTKEKVEVPAHKAPKFKAGAALKDAVNK